MPAFLALIPAAAWRWVAIVAVAAAFGSLCWFKGSAHKQAEWDAAVLRERTQAVELAEIQNRGIAKATAAYAAGKVEDARREASIRAAVGRRCGVMLPARPELWGTDNPAPVPEVSGRRAEGAAEAARGGEGGLTADEIADDEAAICPALYRQAVWLRELAIAAGADKP